MMSSFIEYLNKGKVRVRKRKLFGFFSKEKYKYVWIKPIKRTPQGTKLDRGVEVGGKF